MTAFWNLTNGVRPSEPVPGLFAGVCEAEGHVYDDVYGPKECARCGHRTKRRWLRSMVTCRARFGVNRWRCELRRRHPGMHRSGATEWGLR